MALQKCRECGGMVSSGAKTCPRCGKPNPTTSLLSVCVSSLLLLFIIFACLFWGGGLKSTSSPSPAPPPSALEKMADAFKGGYTKAQIQAKLDGAFDLYHVEHTEDNY